MSPVWARRCLPHVRQVWEVAAVDVLTTHFLHQCHFLSASAVHFSLAIEAPLLMRLCQNV